MGTKIFFIICIYLLYAGIIRSQNLEGNITYAWQSPQKVLFNGPYRPLISLGDSVKMTIRGTVDLRPYEVEKKRGGFLGIGAKRYREIVHDYKNADQVNIFTGIDETNWRISAKQVDRETQVLTAVMENGSFFDGMKKNLSLLAFIEEPGKNLVQGTANLIITMEINSRPRIAQIIKYLRDYQPNEFTSIRELLEVGNVMKQYPNELCDELFNFYKNEQQQTFEIVKTEILQYLLLKSPDNSAIRVKLADSYLQDGNFEGAKQQAKIEIARLKTINPAKMTIDDRILLADAYIVMAGTAELEQQGTQANAFQVAVSFYKLAGDQYKQTSMEKHPKYRDLILKQSKALQRIGSRVAFEEAAHLLEEYLAKTE